MAGLQTNVLETSSVPIITVDIEGVSKCHKYILTDIQRTHISATYSHVPNWRQLSRKSMFLKHWHLVQSLFQWIYLLWKLQILTLSLLERCKAIILYTHCLPVSSFARFIQNVSKWFNPNADSCIEKPCFWSTDLRDMQNFNQYPVPCLYRTENNYVASTHIILARPPALWCGRAKVTVFQR